MGVELSAGGKSFKVGVELQHDACPKYHQTPLNNFDSSYKDN